MAGKKTVGVDTSKCTKVDSQTDVSFERNRRRFLSDQAGLGTPANGNASAASSEVRPPRPRRIQHFRSRPRPIRNTNSGDRNSDSDDGDVGGVRGFQCYFTSMTNDGCKATSSKEVDEKEQSSTSISNNRYDWVWDKVTKSQASNVTSNDQEVSFHLEYSCGTAACRGSMEMSEGQHYWEIKMISAVYGTDMMVGIGTKEINFSHYAQTFCSLLGNDNNGESCGLSYTGAFHFAGSTNMFCGKFGTTDVIGVHLDMWKGSLSFYKNGQYLGIAKTGLLGKTWYPMICSTAARSSMRLVRAITYPSSLQFLCCTVLRKNIPGEKNVLTALPFPPGLKTYLSDRLGWLLGCQVDLNAKACSNKATQTILTINGKLFSSEQDDCE